MYNRGYNKPLLIGAAAFTALTFIFGLFFYVHGKAIPEPTGMVLTQEFVENYADRRAFVSLGGALLVGSLFGFGTVILALIWNLSSADNLRKYGVTCMMLLCALVFPALACGNSIPVIVGKPHVETVKVVTRSEKPGRKHSYYKFRFSNGASCNVTWGEYKNVPDRSEYYVIMSGHECAGAFNADNYSLPSQS